MDANVWNEGFASLQIFDCQAIPCDPGEGNLKNLSGPRPDHLAPRPEIKSADVMSNDMVRRAKLFYRRDRTGKVVSLRNRHTAPHTTVAGAKFEVQPEPGQLDPSGPDAQ